MDSEAKKNPLKKVYDVVVCAMCGQQFERYFRKPSSGDCGRCDGTGLVKRVEIAIEEPCPECNLVVTRCPGCGYIVEGFVAERL